MAGLRSCGKLMAFRIAIANHKGGVAKSTTSLMVAEGLALFYGLRVLAIDLDPQASISTMLLSRQGADAAAAQNRSIAHLLRQLADKKPVHLSGILSTKASDIIELRDAIDSRRVDIIASNRQLLIEIAELEHRLKANYDDRTDIGLAATLAPELERLDKSYDVILFDCPAGTSALALAGIRLSRLVIAPTVLDSVSLTALRDFIDIILKDLAISGQITLKVLPAIFRATDPEQRNLLDRMRAGGLKLGAISRPVPDTVHIRRAVERIRHDSYRSVREKYAGALPDLEALAATCAQLVLSKEPTQ